MGSLGASLNDLSCHEKPSHEGSVRCSRSSFRTFFFLPIRKIGYLITDLLGFEMQSLQVKDADFFKILYIRYVFNIIIGLYSLIQN